MKTMQIAMRSAAFIIISLLVILSGTPAQCYAGTQQEDRFSREELTQMLSPIALYPDSLLAQILMASTYPLEIVEAERWLRRHKGLEGDALYDALREKDWDTSVKSLCNFPDVIFALSDKLEQTRRLGDAFLSQEDEVMEAVQELRNRAYEQGNLRTTKEQKVVIERKIIRIEPAVSHVVYVPVYDPLYVYGPWRYPAYPPYYWYYPSGYVVRMTYIRFGSPVFISIGWFSWTWFDWPALRIYIVVHDASRYHKHYVHRDADYPYWRHDPHHRRRVDYRDRETSDRFEQKPPRVTADSPETRISPPRGTVESPRSTAEDRQKDTDSSQTRPEKERIQHAPSRDTYSVITREKADSPRSTVERREDIDSSQARPARERVQPALSEDKSLTGIGGGLFERKTGNREDESLRNKDMRLSVNETRQQTAEKMQHSETAPDRWKGSGDRRKDEKGSR